MRRDTAHGGDVAEVRGDGLEAYVVPGRRLADDEMTIFDHRVDDGNLLHARRRIVDSTVVADADDDVRRVIYGIAFDGVDEAEFTYV